MLRALEDSRGVYCCAPEWLTATLGQRGRTYDFWNKIRAAQGGGDVLIIAAQLGRRHRDRSVEEARALYAPNEFGLDLLAVATVLVTNPDLQKLLAEEKLAPVVTITCAGHEDEKTSLVPEFIWKSPESTVGIDTVHTEAMGASPATGFFVE